jgi:hypothetical protein
MKTRNDGLMFNEKMCKHELYSITINVGVDNDAMVGIVEVKK